MAPYLFAVFYCFILSVSIFFFVFIINSFVVVIIIIIIIIWCSSIRSSCNNSNCYSSIYTDSRWSLNFYGSDSKFSRPLSEFWPI